LISLLTPLDRAAKSSVESCWRLRTNPVMNMEFGVPCPTARAPVSIALEDGFPVSAEVIARMPAGAIAPQAEAGDYRDAFSAGAEERLLAGKPLRRSPQDPFGSVVEG
jgi:hypothetical protein